MGDPRNPARIADTWNPVRLAVMQEEIFALSEPPYGRASPGMVTVSGGWAWHFMSRRPHEELKIFHDHKDLDLFVAPKDVPDCFARFAERGYVRCSTIYDEAIKDPRHPASSLYSDFYRFRKDVPSGALVVIECETCFGIGFADDERPCPGRCENGQKLVEVKEDIKILVDLFVGEIEWRLRPGVSSVWVVEPVRLLSMYRAKAHQTDDCVAVMQARKLLSVGINPIDRIELTTPTPEQAEAIERLIKGRTKK